MPHPQRLPIVTSRLGHQQVARIASPYGPMVAAACEGSLSGLWFEGQKHFPDLSAMTTGDTPHPHHVKHQQLWRTLEAQLTAYAAGNLQHFDLPLHLCTGTAFGQRVWQRLLQVPFGHTTTYGELATLVNSAPRATGGAVGRNPIAIIVPCHRVVGVNGALTGYAGGMRNKTALLRLEHYFA